MWWNCFNPFTNSEDKTPSDVTVYILIEGRTLLKVQEI